MSQSSSDKYVYFTIGVLKDSETLEALRQDAIKHHMIDHPGQLIALRLAEYYEMMHNVTVQPVMRVPVEATEEPSTSPQPAQAPQAVHPIHLTPPAPAPINSSVRPFTPMPMPTGQGQFTSHPNSNNSFANQGTGGNTGRMRALRPESESIISTSPNADQNADEAADYWNAL